MLGSDSIAGFSGFQSVQHHDSRGDSDTQEEVFTDSVLLQCAKTYGPVDDLSVEIDKHAADMVNHVFDNGMREEEYRDFG